jgi:hypothetical protein
MSVKVNGRLSDGIQRLGTWLGRVRDWQRRDLPFAMLTLNQPLFFSSKGAHVKRNQCNCASCSKQLEVADSTWALKTASAVDDVNRF